MAGRGREELEIRKKTESKLLDRVELEVLIPGRAGRLSRVDALGMVAEEMKVDRSRVGLVSLQEHAGTTDVVGRFAVYGSSEAVKVLHPKHLQVRVLAKEEREKLKQARKKAKIPSPEAK